MRGAKGVVAVIAATTCALTMTASPALAGDGRWGGGHGGRDPVRVVAAGLNFPLQLAEASGSSLLVTESGFAADPASGFPGVVGQITQVNVRSGKATPVVQNVPRASGAVKIGGKIAIVTGDDGTPAGPGEPPPASLLVARPNQAPKQFADLMAFELGANPDGQTQFVDGVPTDALSNPFSVLADRGRGFALVADGGANDVLKVDSRGQVSTFFVPPTVIDGACTGIPNNAPTDPTGCDSVPTGMTFGPGNTLYVATLSGHVPGEGRVYVLDARSGKVKKVIKGFTAPTGVAVDNRGTLYVAEIESNVLVKVDCNGRFTFAEVQMPSSVLYAGGKLYSTANTFIPGQGQILQVNDSAFTLKERPPAPEPPDDPAGP